MNNLSLMLYFAEVADRIGVVSVMLSFALFFAMLFGVCAVTMSRAEHPQHRGYWVPMWMAVVPTLAFFFFVSLAVFIPSQQTIYLIAGSEIGEQVVKTPEAQQMFSDIREVIQQQLKDLKKE